jgi:hypothetical protein
MSCIMWNRLGNATQIGKSEIGNNGTQNGGDFGACKFGNGFSILVANSTDDVTFSFEYIGVHTIEFWYKPNFNYDSGSTVTIIHIPSISSGELRLAMDPSTSKFFTYAPNAAGTAKYVRWDQGAFSSGDLVHCAWVIDKNGIDGGTDTQRFYFNNVSVSVVEEGSGTQDMALYNSDVSTTMYVGGHATVAQSLNGVIDNIKHYNNSKIDFSDRFHEGFGAKKGRVN